MNDHKTLVPELRFPEFLNDGEWERVILEEVCELITKGTTPTTLGFSYTTQGVNFIKIESIENEKINLSKVAFISNECNDALRRSQLKENDILFSIAGALGVIAQVRAKELPANTNQALAIIRLKEEYNKDYILKFLSSPQITAEIYKLQAGAAQLNISLSQVGNFEILIPKNSNEQEKIAPCLLSLDELIAAHTDKLKTLKEHKSGLMQNLFPKEGEHVPKYRFQEFVNDGEWTNKKLSSVANIVTGSTPSTNEPKNYGGNKLFVSPADINDHRYIVQTKTTLSDTGFSKTRHVSANSVLFVCIGSTIGKVAQTEFECATNQQINALTANEGNSNDFLYSILDRNSKSIASIAGNHAVPIINKTDFSVIELKFPPKTQEQTKIASCLSVLDELIKAQTDKIEQLQLHRKGLMQHLFPKLDV